MLADSTGKKYFVNNILMNILALTKLVIHIIWMASAQYSNSDCINNRSLECSGKLHPTADNA